MNLFDYSRRGIEKGGSVSGQNEAEEFRRVFGQEEIVGPGSAAQVY